MIKKTRPKTTGFTLTELVVSISILVLITSLFLANYSGAKNRARLDSAVMQLVSNLRLVQSYALGAKKTPGGEIPTGGWCIYLSAPQSYYRIFHDTSGNHRYNSGEQFGSDVNIDPTGLILDLRGTQTTGQPYYQIYQGSTLIAAKKDLHVCYESPLPTIYITGTNAGTGGGSAVYTGSSTKIQVYDIGSDKYRNIFINDFGLIDVL